MRGEAEQVLLSLSSVLCSAYSLHLHQGSAQPGELTFLPATCLQHDLRHLPTAAQLDLNPSLEV